VGVVKIAFAHRRRSTAPREDAARRATRRDDREARRARVGVARVGVARRDGVETDDMMMMMMMSRVVD
jgi:hypothetical protein